MSESLDPLLRTICERLCLSLSSSSLGAMLLYDWEMEAGLVMRGEVVGVGNLFIVGDGLCRSVSKSL